MWTNCRSWTQEEKEHCSPGLSAPIEWGLFIAAQIYRSALAICDTESLYR